MPSIFISYRRSDTTAGCASWLYERFAARFGSYNVFMDIDSLALGVDFVEHYDAFISYRHKADQSVSTSPPLDQKPAHLQAILVRGPDGTTPLNPASFRGRSARVASGRSVQHGSHPVQSDCHIKGIVIEPGTVLLGSHNWTNQGVEANRDASLLIDNPEIAAYYERVFLHDWERLARAAIREEAMPIPVVPGEEAVGADDPALRRVPWSAWEEE